MSNAWSIVSKVALVFCAILLLSLGLCGFSGLLRTVDKGGISVGIGLFGTLIAVAGLILTGIAAVIVAIISAVRGGPTPPPPPPPPSIR
jgi:hypothetical protein